jgi:hypothetical protein
MENIAQAEGGGADSESIASVRDSLKGVSNPSHTKTALPDEGHGKHPSHGSSHGDGKHSQLSSLNDGADLTKGLLANDHYVHASEASDVSSFQTHSRHFRSSGSGWNNPYGGSSFAGSSGQYTNNFESVEQMDPQIAAMKVSGVTFFSNGQPQNEFSGNGDSSIVSSNFSFLNQWHSPRTSLCIPPLDHYYHIGL